MTNNVNKKVFRLDLSDPLLEKKLSAIRSQLLASSPKHVQQLGRILRRRSIFFFKQFLRKLGMLDKIPKEMVSLFMDYLIIKRIDLRDMEPDARRRLREATLEDQPEEEKTDDYKAYVENSEDPPMCKHCRWFMETPPEDEKTCVELGTKGNDFPCFGFTLKKMP